jgi:mono/diheme cytochrome c family protein
MKITLLAALLVLSFTATVHIGIWQIQAAQHQMHSKAPAPLIPSIQGPALYRAYCASCHGTDGRGTGPMVASLKGKPSDLTQISLHNSGVFPKDRIERIISGEEQPVTGHGSSAMPVWGPIFSQVDNDRDVGPVRIDNLARYLENIQKK